MAKEAIEAVKAAEEKAAQIISDTQKRAAKLLEDVARSERDELNALSQKCEKEKDFAKKELEGELFADEEKFRAELSQKCEMLRKKDDGTRENIIGRIIEAVKSWLELVGLNRERKQVLEYLQSIGCVDISDSRCEEIGTAQTAAAISRFDAYISQIMRALEILPPAADGGGMFRRKTDAAGVAYTADEGEISRTVGIAADIIRLAKEKKERTDELSALDVREKTLEPFRSLDVPPALRKTRRTVIRLGTIEGEHTAEELFGEFEDGGAADVYIEVISATKQQTALWILYPDYLENEAAAVCTRLNLLAPKGLGSESVAEQLGKIAARREEIARQNSDTNEKLSALAAERGALELMLDRLSVRRDKYRVLSGLGITKTAFFLTGYVPEELGQALGRAYAKIHAQRAAFRSGGGRGRPLRI